MLNSRLYYDIKESTKGKLDFHYYTDEVSNNFIDLRCYTKKIDRQEIISDLRAIGLKRVLYSINEAEFIRLLNEIRDYKKQIDELALTLPAEANIATAKLWGPNILERKFADWFIKNGYSIPKNNYDQNAKI